MNANDFFLFALMQKHRLKIINKRVTEIKIITFR